MKSTLFVLLASCLLFVAGCCATHCPPEPAEPTPITQLDGDQVNALLPFMIERKPSGELEYRAIEATGGKVVLHQRRQAFTFDVWIDADGNPVMPPKDGDSAVALMRPTLHQGAFDVLCVFGCEPATSAEKCELIGCEPFADESCGCTPLECSGCIPLWCDSVVSGQVAGRLVML
jgi:hypothetical protein